MNDSCHRCRSRELEDLEIVSPWLEGEREHAESGQEMEAFAVSSRACPTVALDPGKFSDPEKNGFRWFTPKYATRPSNLWDLAREVRKRMLTDRFSDPADVPSEAAIRDRIADHWNARFAGTRKMFLPRFGRDRCTGKGAYYGAIGIPFRWGIPIQRPGADRPRTRPAPAKPQPRPIRDLPLPDGPTIHQSGSGPCGKGGKALNAADVRAVRRRWVEARRKLASAIRRLDHLRSLKARDRARSWNQGLEHYYFGPYSVGFFAVLRSRLKAIEKKLNDPELRLLREGCSSTAKTNPLGCPRTIWLCHPGWSTASPYEQAQTFIHEAAHLVWVFNARERLKYGKSVSRCLARVAPVRARRNADNYGYYVMDQGLAVPRLQDREACRALLEREGIVVL